MYSDSDSDYPDVDYEQDNSWGNDDFDLDDAVDHHEDAAYRLQNQYFELFEAEEALVRTLVSNVRGDDPIVEDNKNPYLFDCNSLLDTAETVDEDVRPESDSVGPPTTEKCVAAASAAVVPLPAPQSEASVVLKHSTATKRLHKPGVVGLLYDIPATDEMNRKALQTWWLEDPVLNSLAPTDNLFVGYKVRIPVGVGLTIFVPIEEQGESTSTSQEEAIDKCVKALAGRNPRRLRLDVEDDLRPFFSESSVKEKQNDASRNLANKKEKAPTSQLSRLTKTMNDPEALRKRVDALGGFTACNFVAVDVEAAVVKESAVPLPLEMAFVDCARCPTRDTVDEKNHDTISDDDWSYYYRDGLNYHVFVHPGRIHSADEQTALMMSVSRMKGSHHIPFRNWRHLRHDYIAMAKSVEWLLSQPGVILINKGSVMDINAIRWLYAAAWQEYSLLSDSEREATVCPPRVPAIDEIDMFDISALLQLMQQPDDKKSTNQQEKEGDPEPCPKETEEDTSGDSVEGCRCWYHALLESVDRNTSDDMYSAHCAWDDAWLLAQQVIKATENQQTAC